MTETDLNLVQTYWQEKSRGESKMTEPDFTVWAEHIVVMSRENGTAQEEIKVALEQAYRQGFHLGKQEGYQLGITKGWAIEQEKERQIK